jgi:segregation and condensation protein A
MNIYDISISQITSQYLEYVLALEESNVMDTAEFMVLAATLIELKSKLMLPRLSDTDEEAEDPREDLVLKLLEYKKYKRLATHLADRFEYGSLFLEKPAENLEPYEKEREEFLKMDIEMFMQAFSNFIYKKRKDTELASIQDKIRHEALSLEQKKDIIRDRLSKLSSEEEVLFKDLITLKDGTDAEKTYDEVLTFISVLDMTRQGEMWAEQDRNFDDIRLRALELAEIGSDTKSEDWN